MSVKIFLPAELFTKREREDCELYGEIQINENNSVSYFIITANAIGDKTKTSITDNNNKQKYRLLGHIQRANSELQQRDEALSFGYDADTPNIYLVKLSIKPANVNQANIFLYDAPKMLQLHNVSGTTSNNRDATATNYADIKEEDEQYNDVDMLYTLLQHSERMKQIKAAKKSLVTPLTILYGSTSYMLALLSQTLAIILQWKPIELLLQQTMLYEHYQMWRKYRKTGKRNLNITLDRIFGMCLTLLLLFVVAHPGDYLIQTSHLVIKNLRILLRSLKGSPIGLKLNVHLNNFFLDCFNYHIDLWSTFLDIIEPLVRLLFVPIAMLGTMGLSFQFALLADLISIISLHTHCFYIYAAVLYKVEIKGLQVLWKVVLGKRYNVLKKRVESHNYKNRQLYLATIFFTSLLFLFPTILVYYIVFTTLRLCIYTVNMLLQLQRQRMLEFPLQLLLKWMAGRFFEKDSLQLQHQQHTPSPLLQPEATRMRMSVFTLNVQASSLSRVFSCENAGILLQEFEPNQQHTKSKSIFKRILEGTF